LFSLPLRMDKNYLLLFFRLLIVDIVFKIDEIEGIEVVGIFYNTDDRLVDYLRYRYGFRFRILNLRGEIPFVWTPVELLVDGFGRIL